MIQALEQTVLELLRQDVTFTDCVRVDAMPDIPAPNSGSVRGDGVCYVRFVGVDMAAVAGMNRGPFVQDGIAQIELHFFLRTLRDHAGAYPLLEKAIEILVGHRPNVGDGFSIALPGLYLKTIVPVSKSKDSGYWHWVEVFETNITYEVG